MLIMLSESNRIAHSLEHFDKDKSLFKYDPIFSSL